MSVAFQKLRTPNIAQVVQESILEEVSEQTRVLGDVLDLSVEKSEYLPYPRAFRGGRAALLMALPRPPQSQGFRSKFLANVDIVKPAHHKTRARSLVHLFFYIEGKTLEKLVLEKE